MPIKQEFNNKKKLFFSIKNGLIKIIAEIYNNPQLVKSKINSFLIIYRSGGMRAVLLKLRDKGKLQSLVQTKSLVEDISQFMRNLVGLKIKSNHLKISTIDKVVKVAVIVPVYRGFDETKKFINSLAYINSVNYNVGNDIPSKLLKNLAQTLGWDIKMSPITNDELLSSVFGQKNGEKSQFLGHLHRQTNWITNGSIEIFI